MDSFQYPHPHSHPYPYQGNQMPYAPYYYPSSPHFKLEPTRPMMGPWHFGGNEGYAYPPECHGCCYLNNQPSYRPFNPPYACSVPHHCHGSYSPYPGFYPPPAHYVPPPYFSPEQSRYEFEKDFAPQRHHCCGCLNHPCKQNEKNGVKIEEHDEDAHRKNAEAIVPMDAKSQPHPYPVVWLPYGDVKREHAEPYKLEHNEAKLPRDMESHGKPVVWSGRSPLNMKRSEGAKKGEDSRTTQQKQDDNCMPFPFPIFWLPYEPGKMEREQGSDSGKTSDKEFSSQIKSKQKDEPRSASDKGEAESTNISEKHNDEKMVNKESLPKIIPVKQLEETETKSASDKGEVKSTNVSTKQNDHSGEKNLDENGVKKSSSPKKPTKLPPVCLRVDPLPRKKSQNGGSRSPSPPGRKGKSLDTLQDKLITSTNRETTRQKDPKTCGPSDCASEVNKTESNTNTINITDGKTRGGGQKDLDTKCTAAESQTDNQIRDKMERNTKTIKVAEGDGQKDLGVPAAESQTDNQMGNGGLGAPLERELKCNEESTKHDSAEGQTRRHIKKQLSEDEAATVIQSAYRGYEVRKWEPLKKLKQIANVKEQAAEIRSRIQALENSSDKPVDNKQKIVIAETIMSLLLKLDTIQGLHPSFREIRKSVARELVNLQEKLDSITERSLKAATQQPVSGEQCEAQTVPAEQCDDQTVSAEQCDDRTVSAERCDDRNVSAERCEDRPIPEERREDQTVQVEQCEDRTVPVEQCEDRTVPVEQCEDRPVAEEQCEDRPVPALQYEDRPVPPEQYEVKTVPVERSEDKPMENLSIIEVKQQGDTEQRDEVLTSSQQASEELEVKEILEHEKCSSPPNTLAEELPNCDVEKTDTTHNEIKELVKELVEPSEKEQESSLSKEIDSDVKNLAEINTEFPQENISRVEEQVAQIQCHVLGEENMEKTDTTPKEADGYVKDQIELPLEERNEFNDQVEMSTDSAQTQPCAFDEENAEKTESKSKEADIYINDLAELFQEEHNTQESNLSKEMNHDDANDLVQISSDSPQGQIPSCVELTTQENTEMPQDEANAGLEIKSPRNDITLETQDADSLPLNEVTELQEVNKDAEDAVAEAETVDNQPTPVSARQISAQSKGDDNAGKLKEESETLRRLMEELIESGKEQLTTITALSSRVKQLEKKLSRNKKLKMKQHRAAQRKRQATQDIM